MKVLVNKHPNSGIDIILSHEAVKECLRRKGKKCFAYRTDVKNKKRLVPLNETEDDVNQAFIYYSSKDLGTQTTLARLIDYIFCPETLPRHDTDLVATVEQLGDRANGNWTKLKIVEIPDGTEYAVLKRNSTNVEKVYKIEEIEEQ